MPMSPGYITYCLSRLTDAELGAIVRKRMLLAAEEQVRAAAPVVEAARVEAEAEQVAAIATEQQQRKGNVLPAFRLPTKSGIKEVPDLDLSDVTSLDVQPSAKQRSPYNKALAGIGAELLDPETCTYATLAEAHKRLMAEQHAVVEGMTPDDTAPIEAAPVDVTGWLDMPVSEAHRVVASIDTERLEATASEPVEVVVAQSDEDSLARSLASLFGESEDEARKRLASY